jgi:hypothetical protein
MAQDYLRVVVVDAWFAAGPKKGNIMKKAYYALCAASMLALATPAIAQQATITATNDTTGQGLAIPIHESQSNLTDNANQVYGSTAKDHMTQDVTFTGSTALQTTLGTGNSLLDITGGSSGTGAGFAFVGDSTVDGSGGLNSIVINPFDPFTDMKFAVDLTGPGTLSIYYLLQGTTNFQLCSTCVYTSASQANTNYLVSVTGGVFDALQVVSSNGATIDQLKQITYNRQTGAVPEPATWAMMLLGFGGIGFAMRRSRRRDGQMVLAQIA